MSLAESSHTPTNEVEEAIDIDSCSEKSLENIASLLAYQQSEL